MVTETPRLTARSVIASTLLGVSPPALPTRVLVATAELLGVRPGAARVAMSRMVAAGELAPTEGGYRLVGHLVQRQARQDLSRHGAAGPWDGTWRTHVITGEARPAAERAGLRTALAALRAAEVREGVWMRPDNLPAGVLPDAERTVAHRTLVLTSTVDHPAALAEELWDLDGWARRARELEARLDHLSDRLDTDGAMASAFVTLAAVLRHLQADPLLPAELLPSGWPGPDLRAGQAQADAAFKVAMAAWQRARA
jgi:phenylacetic acid degradation operon negative regulatory protein